MARLVHNRRMSQCPPDAAHSLASLSKLAPALRWNRIRSPLFVAACALGAPMLAPAESPEMEAFRKEIEGQLATMKGLYEGRIKELESRIGTLESDNARLKQQASPKSKAADSAELANMRQRVEDLESLAGRQRRNCELRLSERKPMRKRSRPSSSSCRQAQRKRGTSTGRMQDGRSISESSTISLGRWSFMDICARALA